METKTENSHGTMETGIFEGIRPLVLSLPQQSTPWAEILGVCRDLPSIWGFFSLLPKCLGPLERKISKSP